MELHSDLDTYLVFHENHAQWKCIPWNCIQPCLNIVHKIV